MLSRRAFLKMSMGALFSLAFRGMQLSGDEKQPQVQVPQLGRTIVSLRYYAAPSLKSTELGYYNTDSVIEIHDAVVGDPEPKHNPIWYRTERGWLHSSYVQAVQNILNEPVWDIPVKGFLAEVTVPFSQAWISKNNDLKRAYRFYYGSTYWVTLVYEDDRGNVWYKITDDLKGGHFYVLAKHLRKVTPQEVLPLSPYLVDKQIQINLAEQRLTAYENGRMVMSARCSTGTVEGDTPTGEFRVERKQPTRHMAISEPHGNGYDLPGVPWVSYISWTGVSLHGTYWHNDYGKPRSHGCINLSPEAARWIYRWTYPVVPVDDDYAETKFGTRVTVV